MINRQHNAHPKLIENGFSLIELLVTVSVLSILVFVALPNFNTFSQHSQVDGVQNQFHSALLYARSEAIRRNKVVKLCRKQANQNQCHIPAAADWKNGWLVFIDANDDSDQIISGSASAIAEKILKISPQLGTSASFVRQMPVGDPQRATICFNGYGMVCSDKDAQSQFIVDSTSDANSIFVRKIFVSSVGKISLQSDKYQ